MKKNKIVCATLILIMVLNCIVPLFKVNAEETAQSNEQGTTQNNLQEIQLNDKLYYAIKSYLTENDNANIKATFNDHDLTVKVDPSLIKRLDLNNAGISDLTGLDVFSNLEHLELSGNKLTKDSNLSVLNAFNNEKFTYLDLSSNQLEDISSISGLVKRLEDGRDEGKEMSVVLSGQHVVIVETKSDLKTSEDDETSNNEKTTTFKLPPILEKAGFLKNIWSTVTYRTQSEPNTVITQVTNPDAVGYLYAKLPWKVSGENSTVQINVSNGEDYLYEGIVKVTIKIGDDYTEDEAPTNLNYAKRNPLVDSEFELYYIITDDRYEAIPIKDRNLYDAIKAQLLKGQDINPDLPNYKYKTTEDNVDFADYQFNTVTIDGSSYRALYKEVDASNNPVYEFLLDTTNGSLYKYETDATTGDAYKGEEVEKDIKEIEIELNDGTLKRGYRISDKTSIENDISTLSDLFEAAYDDAQAFVIKDDILINTIKTLLINNEQISDLTGIEKFVGLTSNLNISHNNLLNIDPLATLEENKSKTEQEIRQKYSYWLSSRNNGNLSSNNTRSNGYINEIKENIENIEKVRAAIIEKLAEYASKEIESGKEIEERNKIEGEIAELIKPVYDQIETENGETKVIKGYTTLLKEAIEAFDPNDDDLRKAIEDCYVILEKLYQIYNDEYKLTTLLTDELNYNDYEAYKAYDEATGDKGTMQTAKAILSSQYSRLVTLYENKALSELDIMLLNSLYRNKYGEPLILNYNGDDGDDNEKKLPGILNKRLERDYSKSQIRRELEFLREVGIYSEIANYCLFKRMNVETEDGKCYEQEYLRNRIADFELEGIPTDLEERILYGTSDFNSIFASYEQISIQYDTDTIYACKGKYIKLKEFDITDELNATDGTYNGIFEKYTLDEIKGDVLAKNANSNISRLDEINLPIGGLEGIIKSVSIKEIDENDKLANVKGTFLYNQLTGIINKLMNADINKITLPRLRVLDISYNNEHRYDSLRMPDLSKISQLTKLIYLKAAGNSITDDIVDNILNATHLRRLDLSENNITMASLNKLINVENLETLNLSKNDISGTLPIDPNNGESVFKHLKELNLSYNKIDDIIGILQYLDQITDDYSNYLATSGYAPKIILDNQQLSLTIDEPLYLTKNPTTVYIALPKILAQLLAIDEDRAEITLERNSNIDSTSFKTSQGKIGEYVSITPKTPGTKVATFKVTPMNGAYDVDTCIGKDTTVEVHYTVVNSGVTEVTVNPSNVSLRPNDKQIFTAIVTGENVADNTVTWSIRGNTSSNTKITDAGELTIGADETATNITVLAVSKQDDTKSGTATVSVVSANSDVISLTSNKPSVTYGETAELTATLISENLADRNVTIEWKIEDNTSTNTKIEPQGDVKENATTITEKAIFTLGEDESRDSSVKITAYLSDNSNIYHTVICVAEEANTGNNTGDNTGNNPGDNTGNNTGDNTGDNNGNTTGDTSSLGYQIKEDYLLGIKAKTPIDAFKNVLIGNQNYTVIVKETDANGNVNVVTSGNMKTGMTVELQDSEGKTVKDSNGNLLVYEVVVKGDVNGDGVANALDSNIIKAHRMELNGVQLVGAQREAADLNNDGSISVQDSRLLLYHRAEVTGYDLNYKAN